MNLHEPIKANAEMMKFYDDKGITITSIHLEHKITTNELFIVANGHKEIDGIETKIRLYFQYGGPRFVYLKDRIMENLSMI